MEFPSKQTGPADGDDDDDDAISMYVNSEASRQASTIYYMMVQGIAMEYR